MKPNPINIGDIFSRIAGVFTGFVGLFLFLISVYYSSNEPNNSLFYLFLTYCCLLVSIGLIDSKVLNNKWFPKEITISSFYTFCFFFPFALIFGIIYFCKWQSVPTFISSIVCWVIQVVFIFLWFFPKIKKGTALKESELMKLDYYSTLVIIALTLVWIIYKIDSIKLGFAAIMTEFLIIQAFIKHASIKKKSKQEVESIEGSNTENDKK